MINSNTERKLAAILFADIAGYTAMMQKDEQLALQKLNHFKNILDEECTKHRGEIIQYYGDGCVIIFSSSSEAVGFAKTVQGVFQKTPIVPVRVGIHSGDIVLKKSNVFGDAVNIASRVESLGVPGSVLLSSNVRNQIKNQPKFILQSLGRFEFKNVENSMTIYALVGDGLVVPEKDKIDGKLKAKKKQGGQSITQQLTKLLIPLVILSLLGFLYLNNSKNVSKVKAIDLGLLENSIAVLPFDNVSQRTDNDPFVLGIHDDLLSQISRVEGMKVISRTSVLHYKNTDKTLPHIADELGVNYILEGSVQRNENQIRVNIKLINAKTDQQLWSNVYTKKFSIQEIFNTQSEIVRDIAEALKITLAPGKFESNQKVPTENAEAYIWYVKATEVWNDRSPEGISRAIEFFNNAIELDSNFALGYAGLSQAYSLCNGYNCPDNHDQILEDAKRMAEKGLEINPELAEAWVALSGSEKFELLDTTQKKANVSYLQKAIQLNPNYALAFHWLGMCYTRIGWNKKALEMFKRGFELDPYSTPLASMLVEQYTKNGFFEESTKLFEKTYIAWINDQGFHADNWQAYTAYIKLGEIEKALAIGQKIQKDYRRDLFRVLVLVETGDASKARALLTSTKRKYPKEEKVFFGLNYDWAEYRVLDAEGRLDELFSHIEKAIHDKKNWSRGIRRYPPSQKAQSDLRYKKALISLDLLIKELPE